MQTLLAQGGLNEYLDDLEKSEPSERRLEKWFYTEWLERRARVKRIAASNAAKRATRAASSQTVGQDGISESAIAVLDGDSRTEEAAAAAELATVREQEIEKAVPMPSFFSLDNPIIIAVTLALFGAAFGGLGR